jgi:hypothetical protein
MSTVETGIAAASAGLSAVATFLAWRTAREANGTAASVAQIERDRWHKDLTPRLGFLLPGPGHLQVRFDGPASLGELHLLLEVRDDRPRPREEQLAGLPTPEEEARYIWGPMRFRPRIDHADEEGRTVAPRHPLEVGETTRLAVCQTVRPPSYEHEDGRQRWFDRYQDAPMRLWVTCEAADHKPWRLHVDVYNPSHDLHGWTFTVPNTS